MARQMLARSQIGACVLRLTLGALLSMSAIQGVSAQSDTTLDTRVGKLELQAGYPSMATAEKLFDEMDFQRATQAFIWAMPAVGFHGLHLAHLNTFGAKDGDIVVYKDLKDKAGMLTPNITTIYIMSFWDLDKQGPLVIEVPPGLTAGGVLDIWQRPVSDTGQTGPYKGQGGKYLIVGPKAEEPKVEGYFVKRSPSVQIWFATRGLSPDAAVADRTLRGHKLYAWSQRNSPGETKYIPSAAKTGVQHSQWVSTTGATLPRYFARTNRGP